MPGDYNHIEQWLRPLVKKLGISFETFARQVGVSRSQIYFYMSDADRPSEEVMAWMCRVLDRPLAEGLRQYTPRRNGRPPGTRTATARLKRT